MIFNYKHCKKIWKQFGLKITGEQKKIERQKPKQINNEKKNSDSKKKLKISPDL